jgi:hypothetical protein
MIANVTQYGNLLVIRDRSGNQIGSISTGGGEFLGHSSAFVVLRFGGQIVTYNSDGNRIGHIQLPTDYRIQSITESGFCARTGNMILVYDSYCNNVDHYIV